MPVRRLLTLFAVLLALPLALARAEEPPPAPPAPPTPAPLSEPLPGPPAEACAACRRMVDEMRDETARIRGLAWKFVVPADLITRKQMRHAFLEEIDTEYPPAKRDRDTAIARRVGMLRADQDIVSLVLDFFEAGVGGYYDPKKKILRIVEGYAGEAQRPTILHELTHALEDQYIDLEGRTKPFEDDGDRTFAEKCLGEGSAETARLIYEAAHPELAAVFREGQANPEMAMGQLKAFARIPAFLFYSTLLHYKNGPSFVGIGVRGGTYPERMAALYNDPPVSQEQILHPERWYGSARDYPQAVVWSGDLAATAGAGWSVYYQMPSGELDIAMELDFHLGPTKGKYSILGVMPYPAARKAASGWDGAWSAFLKKDGLPLGIVQAYAFDSGKDAWEAAEMLGQAAQATAGESWRSDGWKREGPTDGVPAKATLEYTDKNGFSRLFLDGTHVLRVDGVPTDVLTRLWPLVSKTGFVRDARDTWSPEADAKRLAAAAFRDEARGVGLTPAGPGWTIEKPVVAVRNGVATVRNAERDVTFTLVVEDRANALEATMIKSQATLAVEFPDHEMHENEGVAGEPGMRLGLGKGRDGRFHEQVWAAGWERFYSARITAPTQKALDETRADVRRMLEGVVSVTPR